MAKKEGACLSTFVLGALALAGEEGLKNRLRCRTPVTGEWKRGGRWSFFFFFFLLFSFLGNIIIGYYHDKCYISGVRIVVVL